MMESANLKLPPEQQLVVVGSSPPNLGAPSNWFGFGFGFGTTLHHHHHHQQQQHANWPISSSSSSSSSTTPPNFSSCSSSVGNSNNHNNNNQSYDIGMVSNSSSASTTRRYKNCDDHESTNNNNDNNLGVSSDNHHIIHDHNNNIMVHDLGLFPSWNTTSTTSTSLSASYDSQLAKIKEEISESFPKFTELLNSPSNINIDDYGHFLLAASHLKNRDRDQIIPGPAAAHFGGRGQYSQIHPSVNISSLTNYQQNHTSLMKPTTMDHLAPGRFMSTSVMSQPGLNDSLGVFSSNYNLGLVDDPMQQPHDRLSCSRAASQLMSSLNSEMEEIEKRSMEAIRTSNQLAAPNKKSRSESKTTSCPPFKVRKEKLGDRIAALQQLVSPFGKTDTASVLMEAIGYIKFLQNQIDTLSVPYMKSSRNKSTIKTMQGGGGSEEPKRDLRSRGLCLVPLSCMSYVTGDHGGGASIWPPPNFGGRT